MALTPQAVIQNTTANPEVAAVGLAAGFLLKFAFDYRKKRQNNFNI